MATGTNVGSLFVRLEAQVAQFDKDMKRASKRLDDLDSGAKKASGGMDKFGKAAKAAIAVLATKQVLDFTKQVVGLAVDAEEAGSAFRTTFGPAVDDAQRFVEEFANKAGLAEFELQQLLVVTGNVVQGLGGTEQQSSRLAQSMATLAGDVASFSNAAGGSEAVLRALQSALTGEREALKTYGIVISEVEVQQRALNDTGKTSIDQLTRLEKAQATLSLAYDRAGKAVGDLDRTQGSSANTLRRSQRFVERSAGPCWAGAYPRT